MDELLVNSPTPDKFVVTVTTSDAFGMEKVTPYRPWLIPTLATPVPDAAGWARIMDPVNVMVTFTPKESALAPLALATVPMAEPRSISRLQLLT